MKDATQAVWIYDMRTGAPPYGKTNPIKEDDFVGFVHAFGSDPLGKSKRKDEGETGRFRRFTRKEIVARGDNLDITWLKDANASAEDGLETPEEIAAAIEIHLAATMEEVRALVEEISGESSDPTLAEAAE